MKKRKFAFLILALLEGALVMVFEVCAARLLAPFYGTSLYALTSILGITMLSLLIGYYIGGNFVKNGFGESKPILLIILASILLVLLPIVSSFLISGTMNLGLILGSITGSIILLTIPLILLGSVSPMLVEIIHRTGLKAGNSTGNVYSISTLGGVIATFIVGLFLIPTYGVKASCFSIGTLVFLASLFAHIVLKKGYLMPVALCLCISSFLLMGYKLDTPIKPGLTLHYSNDGFMGKLEVYDMQDNSRSLINNETTQTSLDLNTGLSKMMYSHIMATCASLVPKNERNNAVIIGMAGGSLVKELNELEFDKIVAIDVDPRTKFISEKYFEVNPNSYEFVEDDGRHYLGISSDKYNLIIIDVSASEEQPCHLYTNEAFKLYKEKLTDNGIIVLNIIDHTDANLAYVLEGIADAMDYQNLSPRLLNEFYPISRMDNRNFQTYIHERIIIGSNSGFVRTNNDVNDLNICCGQYQYAELFKEDFMSLSYYRKATNSKGFIDDIPKMDKLNYKRISKLRSSTFKK